MHIHPPSLFFTTILFILISLHSVNATSTGAFQPVDSCQKHDSCQEEQGNPNRLRVRFRRRYTPEPVGEGDEVDNVGN